MAASAPSPVGIVLAAGAGRRWGGPKALVVENGRAWVELASTSLRDAGCDPVLVVLGADPSTSLLPDFARVVVAEQWALGMSASLRAGLDAAQATDAASALISLVDLPRLPVAAHTRVLGSHPADPAVLRQARYRGVPGHPVLIGRRHWIPLAESLHGDEGARRYLARQGAEPVECSDLFDGRDLDVPPPHR